MRPSKEEFLIGPNGEQVPAVPEEEEERQALIAEILAKLAQAPPRVVRAFEQYLQDLVQRAEE